MEENRKNPYKPALCKIENDYEKKVREEIFDSGEFADITFLVGVDKRPFKAHRFILITSSMKFKQMMELHKDPEKPILIPEIEPSLFDQLLRVIYLHRLELYSFENAVACSKMFAEFGLASAVKECQEYLKQPVEVTVENAISLFEMNFGIAERAETLDECRKLFSFHTHDILKSAAFSRARTNTIAHIFEQPQLAIDSELDLLNALRDFAEMHGALPPHNLEGNDVRFRELVKPAMQKIRFLSLHPKDFAKSESVCVMLNDTEIASILANLIVPKNPLYKVPEGFSVETFGRGASQDERFQDAELTQETMLPGFANTAEVDSQVVVCETLTPTSKQSVDWTPSKVSNGKIDDETSGAGTMEVGNPIGNSTLDSSVFADNAEDNHNTLSDQSTPVNPDKPESIVCVPDLGHFSGIEDDKSFRSTNGNVSPAIQEVWVKKIDENKNYSFTPVKKAAPVGPGTKSPAPFSKNQAPFKPQGQRVTTNAPANVQIIPKVVTEHDDEWA